MSTTNEKIALIESDIKELMGWIEADIEHSTESNDKASKSKDLYRFNKASEALNAIQQCYKQY